MKTLLAALSMAAALIALSSPALAAPDPSETTPPGAAATPVKDVFPRWSVVGEWRVTNPDWTDILTLNADGTMATARQKSTGRWILTADGGTPVLVFRWDLFGTESVSMVTLDHFRGQKRNGRFIDMQRSDAAAKTAAE